MESGLGFRIYPRQDGRIYYSDASGAGQQICLTSLDHIRGGLRVYSMTTVSQTRVLLYIFLYNCEAKLLICQSPWVTGKNWCIGCIGDRRDVSSQGLERPAGEWVSYGTKVTPESLYEGQLSERHARGEMLSGRF